MTEKLKGYKKETKTLLNNKNIGIWDILKVKTDKAAYQGILLPRNEYSESGFIELKLKNNYNVGIKLEEIKDIEKIGKKEAKYKIPEKKFPKTKGFPEITLLGTGGTVASRLDYTTGAVIPAFTPGELFSAVPELAEVCNLETIMVFEILSENMKPQYWQELADEVAKQANSAKDGVMIAHGTDTMGFTSAALSFMLKDLNIPVVFVGSQRSSDRPSSDAPMNLINAATVATSNIAEVVIVMMGSSAHDYGLIHRGTLVRKMHTSYRNTFRTIDDIPLGMVKNRKIRMFKDNYNRRNDKKTIALTDFEEKVALIYSHVGLTNEEIDFYIDKGYKGIVFAGTGLGHVSTRIYDALERALEEEIIVLMTSQTLHGFVGMNVYSTGRELLNLGVIPGRNMIPEVAYVKLGWVLGQTSNFKEAKALLTTNIAGEFIDREIPIAYNYNIDQLLKNNKV
ncbi:MAG: Glu-tRNA(Gln) amidotransferase subunit GatD [Candidatus Lokiarchaeota archaeon]|nr:Glu-tRNA(Gln) amidotransferase subunit GatD [Candidatus Lokiarchaeota archaeon]MBD3199314.1 Glu-tRNA(Gln) amidotransferase subunit GatD [Candidatus Lokiarchaeota archaeon]